METCVNCREILNDYMVADGCDHCEDCFRYYEEHGVHAPTQPASPPAETPEAETPAETNTRLVAEIYALKIELAELQADNEALRRNQAAQSNHISIADGLRKQVDDLQAALIRSGKYVSKVEAKLENAQRVNGAQADEMIATRDNEERYRKALSEVHAIAVKNKGGFNANPMNKIFNAAHQALANTEAEWATHI